MYKGICLCALLAVICANSLAKPTGSADEENDAVERFARGWGDTFGKVLKNFAKVAGVKAAKEHKQTVRSAEPQGLMGTLISKQMKKG
ncbi:hypothetical protein XENTR_v10016307 [Xenopus tropicalis]|uniref:Prolevitide-like n=1 Tax=Xenopus tropicalis TaxID=8364 RepID=A0A803JZK3_XENTR|nr:prolevitide-like [Xenopus tropicalis]KAE8596978.1 hypothetical protein XENTR_v10016307 [Xenopus tropicalis]KAE8596979.1 hypothetical protein XENTR_v10016307 [Xenopus tropicalis]